jgi:hypothetical protein
MRRFLLVGLSILAALLLPAWTPQVQGEMLKPFVLGNTPPGDMTAVAATVSANLRTQGFTIVGTYSPYPAATVICATNDDLLTAAANATNGGFGAAQRIAVTDVDGKLQVSYMNPAYLGTAYGLGRLATVSAKLDAALGHVSEFGARGIEEEKLAPGKYHYKIFMPYFNDVDVLNTFPDYQTGVETVEKNLAVGKGIPHRSTGKGGERIRCGDSCRRWS